MKRAIWWVVFFIFSSLSVSVYADTLAMKYELGDNSTGIIYSYTSTYMAHGNPLAPNGASQVANASGNISAVTIKINRRLGGTTGNHYVQLHAVDSANQNLPQNAFICQSNATPSSSIASTGFAWYNFSFNKTACPIVNGTQYRIVFNATNTPTSNYFECSNTYGGGSPANLSGRFNNATGLWATRENIICDYKLYLYEAAASPSLSVALNAPANNTETFNSTVKFNFNATGALTTVPNVNCTLLVNGSVNASMLNVALNATYQEFNSSMSAGAYYWAVNCSNSEVSASSETRNLTVKTAGITVALNSPANNTELNNITTLLSYNVSGVGVSVANCSLYVDGSLSQTTTGISLNASYANFNYTITSLYTDYYYWEVRCTNNDIYNSSAVTPRYVNFTSPVSVTNIYPLGAVNNTDTIIFTYNLNFTSSGLSSDCLISVNDNPANNFQGGYCNPSTGTNITNNCTRTLATYGFTDPGVYYWATRCYLLPGATLSMQSSGYSNFTYDPVFPAITLLGNNSFSADYLLNNGYSSLDDILNLSVNFSDNFGLYGYEINITNVANGSTMYNFTNTSLSYPQYLAVYKSVNVSTWSNGSYAVYLGVADGHTARAISDYQVTKKKSSITFKPDNDNNIKIETRSTSTIDAIKELDRYSFTVAFDDGLTTTRVFDVKTDLCKLQYMNGSTYKAHFVSSCDARGGNWVDFEGVSGAATVAKIDDYHYTVTIANVPPVVTFRSIGGLNTLNTTYYFYHATSNKSVTGNLTNTTGRFFLNLSTNDYQVRNLTFTFNGVTYNPTVAYASSCLISPGCEYWTLYNVTLVLPAINATYGYNWTINESVYGLPSRFAIRNITGSVAVSNWSVGNCSIPFNETRLRFNIYAEDNPATSIYEDVQYYGNFTPDGVTFATVNTSMTNRTTFDICVYPNVTMTLNLYVVHNTSAYFHRYYIQNTTYPYGAITNYSLYNSESTTGRSSLRVTARDQDTYSYYLNLLGVLQRFYVGEGVWRSVQMDRSGDYGLLAYDIKELTTDYRVLYYDESNNLLLQTDSVKFACSGGVCDATQLVRPYSSTATSTDTLTATSTYNNVTHIITTTWTSSNPAGETANFEVTHETMTGQEVACSGSQTGAGGVFTCNVSAYNSAFFVTLSNGDGLAIYKEIVQKMRSKLGASLDAADQAIYGFGLMVTIVAAGLFSPVATLISSVIGLVIVFFLGLVTPLTITMLIIAAVVSFILALRLRT